MVFRPTFAYQKARIEEIGEESGEQRCDTREKSRNMEQLSDKKRTNRVVNGNKRYCCFGAILLAPNVAPRCDEHFMGPPPLRSRLPLGDWQTNLDRSSFAVDMACAFESGRAVRYSGEMPPPRLKKPQDFSCGF
jgi:hypothetical protein